MGRVDRSTPLLAAVGCWAAAFSCLVSLLAMGGLVMHARVAHMEPTVRSAGGLVWLSDTELGWWERIADPVRPRDSGTWLSTLNVKGGSRPEAMWLGYGSGVPDEPVDMAYSVPEGALYMVPASEPAIVRIDGATCLLDVLLLHPDAWKCELLAAAGDGAVFIETQHGPPSTTRLSGGATLWITCVTPSASRRSRPLPSLGDPKLVYTRVYALYHSVAETVAVAEAGVFSEQRLVVLVAHGSDATQPFRKVAGVVEACVVAARFLKRDEVAIASQPGSSGLTVARWNWVTGTMERSRAIECGPVEVASLSPTATHVACWHDVVPQPGTKPDVYPIKW